MGNQVRLTLTEYVWHQNFISDATRATGLPRSRIVELIDLTSGRLSKLLGLSDPPLQTQNDAVKISGCAGLVRVSPTLELEVMPKFLSANDSTWREDFFLIATLSRTGRILTNERVRSGYDHERDLATLVGNTMVEMYWENHRRPIRLYRQRKWKAFAFEGDVNFQSIALPESDGFSQSDTILDHQNVFNSVLHKAIMSLLPDVRHAETSVRLTRVRQHLSPQRLRDVSNIPQRLPSRHRRWQPLYDLARQVLKGFGLGYKDDRFYAPGFVISTWKAWEDTMLHSLRTGMSNLVISEQKKFRLGTRNEHNMNVYPDIVVSNKNGTSVILVVDSKYKTRIDGRKSRIVESDVYESLAFMKATNCSSTVLLYPMRGGLSERRTGSISVFEEVKVGSTRVIGVEVDCRGISETGFASFAAKLAHGIRGIRGVHLSN